MNKRVGVCVGGPRNGYELENIGKLFCCWDGVASNNEFVYKWVRFYQTDGVDFHEEGFWVPADKDVIWAIRQIKASHVALQSIVTRGFS